MSGLTVEAFGVVDLSKYYVLALGDGAAGGLLVPSRRTISPLAINRASHGD